MSFENMPDERLIHFYENIRRQAEADRAHKHQFLGPTVRQYADSAARRDGQTSLATLADRLGMMARRAFKGQG